MAAADYGMTDTGTDGYLSMDPMAGMANPGGPVTADRIPGVNGYYQNAGDMVSGGGAWVPYSSVTDPTTGRPYQPPQGGVMPTGQQTGPATGGAQPQISNPNDPNQVRAFFQWRASQQGADPILQTPGGIDYYTTQTLNSGGLTDPNYWSNKSTLAQFGGAVGAGGQSSGGALGSLGGGFGSLMHSLPTQEQALQMPGLQFALNRGSEAIQHSAAARGTLLSGGTLKSLADYTTGAALQGYGQLAGLQYQNQQGNFSNLYNLGNLGLNASTVGATGRPV